MRRGPLCLCVMVSVCLAGCGALPWGGSAAIERTPENIAERYDAMAPVAVRVHPLTRLERAGEAPDAPVRLALHVELLDRHDQGLRWLGDLHVQVLRPDTDSGPDAAVRELVYDKPLTNPGENIQAWDRVTRTYALLLADLPGWAAAADARVALRVEFTYLAADGSVRLLRAGGDAQR